MDFITDIDNVMEGIEYGWVDRTGKRYTKLDEFGQKYMLQLPNQLRKSKLGVCWDQVELERELFAKRNIPFETYFIVYYDDDKCPTHTFILFEYNNKIFWYEHAWATMRGLHEYDNLKTAISDIRNKFINYELNNKYDSQNLVIYEYDAPKGSLSCLGFYKHCEKGKQIQIDSL